ncbi:hypothetical protein ABZY31_01685 [Streptomyces sp. NPDC006529]|uniref:hypothetical protein n=1 Tax=Streptomyces sp. NPDC006529 TaxID=3157177 RepID=UPI0033A966A5
MSRPAPRPWCLLGAVLAVLLGCLAPVASAARAGSGPVYGYAAGPVASPPARAAAVPEAVPAERGPSCSPADADQGRVPAVPQRPTGDHGHPPLARCLPDQPWHGRGAPLRVLARGPDRVAPGPLELSVMRV